MTLMTNQASVFGGVAEHRLGAVELGVDRQLLATDSAPVELFGSLHGLEGFPLRWLASLEV